MESFQSLALDMGIDLRRRKLGMPQHRLDGTKVGAMLQQMRGKRMSEHVGGNWLGNPGLPRADAKQFPKALPTQLFAAPCDEKMRTLAVSQ